MLEDVRIAQFSDGCRRGNYQQLAPTPLGQSRTYVNFQVVWHHFFGAFHESTRSVHLRISHKLEIQRESSLSLQIAGVSLRGTYGPCVSLLKEKPLSARFLLWVRKMCSSLNARARQHFTRSSVCQIVSKMRRHRRRSSAGLAQTGWAGDTPTATTKFLKQTKMELVLITLLRSRRTL